MTKPTNRRSHPPDKRGKCLDRVEHGEPIRTVAREEGVSRQSIYTWLKEAYHQRLNNAEES